jgi:hypothetical protein
VQPAPLEGALNAESAAVIVSFPLARRTNLWW